MNNDSFYDDYDDIDLGDLTESPKVQQEAKKREKLKNNISRTLVFVLIIAFALVTLFLIVFPRSTVSKIENRNLATFPSFSLSSYFSGEFTSGVATFYDDTVPYRDDFKKLGSKIKSIFGIKALAAANPVTTTPTPVPEDSSSETSTAAPATTIVSDFIAGAAGRSGTVAVATPEPTVNAYDFTAQENPWDLVNGLAITNWNGHYQCMELFGGGGGSAYAEGVNLLQNKLDSNVKVYSMPAPTSGQFYLPANAQDYNNDQKACFDGVAEKLSKGITSINLCPVIANHTLEPIYLRTDHHWQPLGAYYAAKAFAEAAGVPFADISEYTEGANEGYVGTMYAFSSDSRLLDDPEDFTYYVPKAEYTAYYYDTSFNYNYSGDLFAEVDTANSYLMFMGGDEQVVKVNTAVKNGRKLLVVKDSYGNAEIPFYTSSFEQIYVVDVRYFNCNLVDFVNDMGITDVLFTMSAFSTVGDNGANISNLVSYNSNGTIVDTHLNDSTEESATSDEPTGTVDDE